MAKRVSRLQNSVTGHVKVGVMVKLPMRHMVIGMALTLLLAVASCTGAGSSPETTATPSGAQSPAASTSAVASNTPTVETNSGAAPAATEATTAAGAADAAAQPVRFPPERYDDLEIVTLLPQDAIPAIDNPRFLSAAEAGAFYDPDELVMGVEFNGEARAYSVPFLSRHEIVNDTVGGVKIAVTW